MDALQAAFAIINTFSDFFQLGKERKRLYDTTPEWSTVYPMQPYIAVIDVPMTEGSTEQPRYALRATEHDDVKNGLASLLPPKKHTFRIYLVENIRKDDFANHLKERYQTSIPRHSQRGVTALPTQWRQGTRRRNWTIDAYRIGATRHESGRYIEYGFLKGNTIRQRLSFCILAPPLHGQDEAFGDNEWLEIIIELPKKARKWKNYGGVMEDEVFAQGLQEGFDGKPLPSTSSPDGNAEFNDLTAKETPVRVARLGITDDECDYAVAIVTVNSLRQQNIDAKRAMTSASIETQDWDLLVKQCHDRLCTMLLGNTGDLRSIGEMCPQLPSASMSTKKQMLILWYFRALLQDYETSMAFLITQYASRKDALTDPRRGALTKLMLDEITRDTCFYEEVKNHVLELSAAVEFVSASLKRRFPDRIGSEDLYEQLFELEASCEQLRRTLEHLTGEIEYRLRLFELSRGLHEASNVRLLGILASMFLPLSLACGILSMSTRLADLHFILYDFFGVLFIIGTVVIGILVVLKILEWTRELGARLNRVGTFRICIGPFLSWIFRLALVYSWSLCLSSFMVGMVLDVGLGLSILGYGFAALGGLVTLFVLFVVVLLVFAYLGFEVVDYIKTARSNRRAGRSPAARGVEA